MAEHERNGKMSDAEKLERTVSPRVADKTAARHSLDRATSRVTARTAIDFVRTVRR